MLSALTRKVGKSINNCELTYADRQQINVEKAQQQHMEFENALRKLGVNVLSLESDDTLPDSVFVEDTAVITKEFAVITPMGTKSRKDEPDKIAEILKQYRPLKYINKNTSLEGGDIVQAEDTFYVGISSRTNHEGFENLAEILLPQGYKIVPVQVYGCLHLTTGSTYIGNNTMIANPAWVDVSKFEGMEVIEIEPDEPWAGNAIQANGKLLFPSSSNKTSKKVSAKGFEVYTVDISELEKAEAGLTCMSLLFQD